MSGSMIVMEAWIAMVQGTGYRVEEDRMAICMEFTRNHESDDGIYEALGFYETVHHINAEVCSKSV